MHDMKVLALRADAGGCAFYRIQEPARVVNEQYNIEVTVDTSLPIDGEIDRAGNMVIHSIDTHVDVIIFQRPLLASFVPAIKECQKRGIACVVEIDDDFHAVEPDNIAWPAVQPHINPQSNKDWIARAAMMADWVTVSTPALARRYGSHGRVSVLRNYVPESIFDIDKKIPDDPRVGWSGTLQTHPWDLDVTGTQVGAAVGRYGTAFSVVGDGFGVRDKLRIPERIDITTTGWVPREDYYDAMAQNIDIGIVPLNDSPFNHAKSWLKGLEMAALGIPFIASPTPEYNMLAQLGIGQLAHKAPMWQKGLKQLLTNRDLLLERSAEYKKLASTLTYEKHAEDWVVAWLHALAHRKKNPA